MPRRPEMEPSLGSGSHTPNESVCDAWNISCLRSLADINIDSIPGNNHIILTWDHNFFWRLCGTGCTHKVCGRCGWAGESSGSNAGWSSAGTPGICVETPDQKLLILIHPVVEYRKVPHQTWIFTRNAQGGAFRQRFGKWLALVLFFPPCANF